MTRLDSSARDYAIACLATGDSVVDVLDWWYHGADLAYWRSQWVEGKTPRVPWRILRARVALYLRTLRRAEAWERWYNREDACDWARYRMADPYGDLRHPWETRFYALRHARPLWTSAPPHEPGVTARMRRERR